VRAASPDNAAGGSAHDLRVTSPSVAATKVTTLAITSAAKPGGKHDLFVAEVRGTSLAPGGSLPVATNPTATT